MILVSKAPRPAPSRKTPTAAHRSNVPAYLVNRIYNIAPTRFQTGKFFYKIRTRLDGHKRFHGGSDSCEGLLNRVEMAFRLYDPCMSCATHSLPGTMPLIVNIRNTEGRLVQTLRRDG